MTADLPESRCGLANEPGHQPHDFAVTGEWPKGGPHRRCVGGPRQTPDLTPAERATIDRIEQAPDALGLREEVAEVLAAHRVNYHQRNIGGETASTLRYTSCEGCDWLGGWHDEAGWEKHLADALLPLIERETRGER